MYKTLIKYTIVSAMRNYYYDTKFNDITIICFKHLTKHGVFTR